MYYGMMNYINVIPIVDVILFIIRAKIEGKEMAVAYLDYVDRKITKIGNSLGVSLPQDVLEHLDIKQGDKVRINLEEDGRISIKKFVPNNDDVLKNLDQDFLDGLEYVFKNYDDTLKNLADR
ncbi:AbrB/MazE/SpoVT family DNA-binding domain-containing protein [Oceanobacillus iheyensis]|uniref:AbrB/MazE/SpoVT family DNA-binding domain-containing protein n=1 Tax=Oceanobacillus iheyensis TaxID=182710 RepID=UPI00363303E3